MLSLYCPQVSGRCYLLIRMEGWAIPAGLEELRTQRFSGASTQTSDPMGFQPWQNHPSCSGSSTLELSYSLVESLASALSALLPHVKTSFLAVRLLALTLAYNCVNCIQPFIGFLEQTLSKCGTPRQYKHYLGIH